MHLDLDQQRRRETCRQCDARYESLTRTRSPYNTQHRHRITSHTGQMDHCSPSPRKTEITKSHQSSAQFFSHNPFQVRNHVQGYIVLLRDDDVKGCSYGNANMSSKTSNLQRGRDAFIESEGAEMFRKRRVFH